MIFFLWDEDVNWQRILLGVPTMGFNPLETSQFYGTLARKTGLVFFLFIATIFLRGWWPNRLFSTHFSAQWSALSEKHIYIFQCEAGVKVYKYYVKDHIVKQKCLQIVKKMRKIPHCFAWHYTNMQRVLFVKPSLQPWAIHGQII